MQLDAELRYPAPPSEVAAMLADPAFVDEKCERMHAHKHEVRVDGSPARVFTVTTVRTMSTDRIPDLVRPLVGRHILVQQVDRWLRPDGDGNRDGYLTLHVTGLPVSFEGRYELRTLEDGSRQSVSGQLRAAVPVFGHQVERMAEQAIRAGLDLEQRLGTAWLAAHAES